MILLFTNKTISILLLHGLLSIACSLVDAGTYLRDGFPVTKESEGLVYPYDNNNQMNLIIQSIPLTQESLLLTQQQQQQQQQHKQLIIDNGYQMVDLFEGDIVTNKKQLTLFYGENVANDAEAAGVLMNVNDSNNQNNNNNNNNSNNNSSNSTTPNSNGDNNSTDGNRSRRELGLMTTYEMMWKTRDSNNKVIVPYDILQSMPGDKRMIIIDAMREIESKTDVVKFIQRTNEPDWIFFQHTGSGCSSPVGRQGGKQIINLQSGCNLGQSIHEIYHSLGFWHESSRSDRDDYITILWDNIQSGKEVNFNKASTNSLGSPYDYSSIMHFSSFFYGKIAWSCTPTEIKSNTVAVIHFQQKDLNSNMDFCLSVNIIDNILTNGQTVVLRQCNDNNKYQNWIIESNGIGFNVIRAYADPTFCLTVDPINNNLVDGAPFVIKKCVEIGFTRQLFILEQTSWNDAWLRWEVNSKYVLTRNSTAMASNTYSMILDDNGADQWYNQKFRIDFVPKQTGRSATVNAFCRYGYLTTIDSKGHRIGLLSLTPSDIQQLQLLYQCPSGPRNITHFCSTDCKCKINQGRCTSDDQCNPGLMCKYDGLSLNRCVPKTSPPTQIPTSPTNLPSSGPIKNPTKSPSRRPFKNPTPAPTLTPTSNPITKPPTTKIPTKNPNKKPSKSPSKSPTKPLTSSPTKTPTKEPSEFPTKNPTKVCIFEEKKSCLKDEKCIWIGSLKRGYCTEFSCDKFKTKFDCISNKNCIWMKGACLIRN